MDPFVAQRNIDHYLGLLDSPDMARSERDTIRSLLKDEVHRLGPYPAHLDFVQKCLTGCEKRASDLQKVRDSLPPGSTNWENAAEVLANLKDTLNLLWNTCQRLRIQIERNAT